MSDAAVSSSLDQISEKVAAGGRLSAAEGLLLFQPEVDLHAVGRLADGVRRRRHGDVAYYNINAHLNPTNVCVWRCRLCAYSCDPGDRRAYVMGLDEMVAQAEEAAQSGATELHVVSGLHPDKPFAWYVEIIRRLHAAVPRLHLKAWTAVEIGWFARISELSIEKVLATMINAGLGSLPGGGAEIFDPQVRRQIAAGKPGADVWLDVHRTAHRLGLRSNATMLYGHVETAKERIDHLVRLRELQDETGGFQAFIPLVFHPGGTQLAHLEKTSGLDDLRTMAVGRLVLDNFEHVKAYWISLGVGTAQAALAYGADDLDGTVRQERIHHDAGSRSPQILTVSELRRLIVEAGRQPIERDTLYRPVRRDGAEWEVAG
jgi:aminodeoxyfutalosine synthase